MGWNCGMEVRRKCDGIDSGLFKMPFLSLNGIGDGIDGIGDGIDGIGDGIGDGI